jgi:hypothetical protein
MNKILERVTEIKDQLNSIIEGIGIGNRNK